MLCVTVKYTKREQRGRQSLADALINVVGSCKGGREGEEEEEEEAVKEDIQFQIGLNSFRGIASLLLLRST